MRKDVSLQRYQSVFLVTRMDAGNLHIFQPRRYREGPFSDGLIPFTITVGQSDLFIRAARDRSREVVEWLQSVRADIEAYGREHPSFLAALEPTAIVCDAPRIIREMALGAARWNVGPMAAVAGAISERIARLLHDSADDVFVENGGDIYLFSKRQTTIEIYTGARTCYGRVGICLPPCPDGVSVCTSSGSVGHSLSFGNADAVTVVADHGSDADAAATFLANNTNSGTDIPAVLKMASSRDDVIGVAVLIDGQIGLIGERIALCPL